MRNKLTIVFLALIALVAAPAWAQYPVTDAFSGTGALSSNWTATTGAGTPFVALAQASGKAVPSVSGSKGLETYTGVTFTADQYSQAKWVIHTASGGVNGVCVRMSTAGNGICWLADFGGVFDVYNGVYNGGNLVTGCPVPATGDTVQLLAVGTTYTCKDITAGTSASGVSSVYVAGNPGILVDQGPSTSYALSAFQADCSPTCSLGTVATPTFSPAAGSYGSTQTVTISSATTGATIYYTTNGTTPTTSSTLYSSAISVSATETVKALGVKTGYTNSAIGSAAYTITTGYPVTDSFSGTGALSANWTATTGSGTPFVALAQASGKAVPSVSGSKGLETYTGVTFTADQYSQAKWVIHTASGGVNGVCVRMSTAGNGICWLADFGGVFDVYNGVYNGGNLVTGCPVPATGDTIQLLAVGTTYTCKDITTGANASGVSSVYVAGNPGILVDQGPSTSYALAAFQADCSPTCASGGGGTVATPTFSPVAGTYTSAQTVTISTSTTGSTIYYTTNGTTPTTGSAVYSSPISVGVTETVKALGVKSGYTNSAIGSAAYTINLTVATPTFSPAAGTYTSAQSVTISTSTAGSTIYYTTNGTTPTTGSTVYSSPITVGATETVKALAVKSGYTNSAIGSAAYTITLTVATPTFSPAGGTYGSAQSVTISTATTGSTIYYTTNGTTPTTGSSVYSSAISVATSETVKALGVKSGYTNSAIGSATYTIGAVKTVTKVVMSPHGGVLQPGATLQFTVVCTYSDATSDNCASAGGATWSTSSVASTISSSGLYTEALGTAWQASHAYALGALVRDSNGYIEQAVVAGTSGSSITWPSRGTYGYTDGSYYAGFGITDGTVVWNVVASTGDGSYAVVTAGGISDKAGVDRQSAGDTWYQFLTPGPLSSNTNIFTVGSTVTIGSAISANDPAMSTTGTPFQNTCTWSSSNTGIATVDIHGQVTAVAPGAVTITCGRNGNGVFGTSTKSGWVSPGNTIALTVVAGGTGTTTWYVRPDGGTLYSSTNTAGQCNGKSNAAYSGSGTNQACAAGNFRYLWADGVTYGLRQWVISGGDTVIIAQKTGGYNIGLDAPGGAPDWLPTNCHGDSSGCTMPTIPSGSATQHTKILGANYASCHADSSKSLLNISYAAYFGINVSDSQFVDVACLELADQAACGGNSNYTHACTSSDDFGAMGIVESAMTSKVTYTDVFIHGLTGDGIHGATGVGVVADHVHIRAMPNGGINMDDGAWGSSNISVAGGFTMTNSITEFTGCVEEYPIVHTYPYIECRDQAAGAYGDGFGTASTTGDWYFANDVWQYNYQDGLDLLHSGMQNFTVINSMSRANVGQSFKIGSGDNIVFQNNISLANCFRTGELIGDEPSSALAPGGGAPGTGYNLCRAGANTLFNFTDLGTYAVQNNTFITTNNLDSPFIIGCEGGWDFCENANTKFQNNLAMGYQDNLSPNSDGNEPALFYLTSPGLINASNFESTVMPLYNGWAVRNHNIFYYVRPTWCPTPLQTGETCDTQDPMFVSQPVNPMTSESEMDNFNFTPASGSPLIGAGVAIPGITTDYYGATRPNPPSIGAVE